MKDSNSETRRCGTCDGNGTVDSGGVTPWGAPIAIECPECLHVAAERAKIAQLHLLVGDTIELQLLSPARANSECFQEVLITRLSRDGFSGHWRTRHVAAAWPGGADYDRREELCRDGFFDLASYRFIRVVQRATRRTLRTS